MRRPVGVKWIRFGFYWSRCFSRRVATVAMLPFALSRSDSVRSVHIGCSRFSRCCYLFVDLWFCSCEGKLGQAINAVIGTRLWLFVFPFLERFCFLTRPLLLSFRGCCAAVRKHLRSPTGDAATPPAFSRSQRWLVSCRFSHHARPASGPSAADRCPLRMVPECGARLAPAAFADSGSPSLLMCSCGSLCPEFLRPGCNPR